MLSGIDTSKIRISLIDVSQNHISMSKVVCDRLYTVISKKQLGNIILSHNNIDENTSQYLSEALQKLDYNFFKQLNLDNNRRIGKGAKHIAEIIKHTSTI